MSAHWLAACVFSITIPSVACFSVFVRVNISSSTPGPRDNTTAYDCGSQCLQKITGKDFCFGFSITKSGACAFNMVRKLPAKGDYYMLRDYGSTAAKQHYKQCGNEENAKSVIYGAYKTKYAYATRIYNGKLFLIDSTTTTGATCRSQCTKLVMDLISIRTTAENDFIQQTVCDLHYPVECSGPKKSGHIAHLGIDVNIETKSWRFTDGTLKSSFQNTNFDYGNGENCARLTMDGTWEDASCVASNEMTHCICSKTL